jgi:protein-tyrosine phosphatase
MDAGGILVHCYGGRSRSVAFVAAFLMSCCGWSFDYDINIIKAARPAASINPGFEAQLRAYAQTNYDVYAAQQVLLQSRLRALKKLRVF